MDILVADGDDAIREVVRDILAEAGYSVIEARTGREALAQLRESHCALLALIDGRLPATDGVTILRAARCDVALGRHRYVFLSTLPASHFPQELWNTLRGLGAAVIEKPFELDVFSDTVAAQLRSVAHARRGRCAVTRRRSPVIS